VSVTCSACDRSSPTQAETHFNLGTAHEAAGELAAARTAYERAISLDLDDESRAHNNLGGVLLATGKPRKAAAAYAAAVEAEPSFADGWYNLGNAMLALGRPREADARLRTALRLEPTHARALRKLEHVRAFSTRQRQEDAEAEHRLRAAQAAADKCSGDRACVEQHIQESDARRDADGPLIA
jgi:tetratricopeptide (TPR) repeat protein